ncbi:MAG: MATE family efflux transporter [Chloroflexi bacterium OHK40]
MTIETTTAPITAPALDLRRTRRRVFSLAAPVIGENLLQTLLGVVDTLLVAGLGAVALAGVGAALQVVYVILAALSALSVGASVLVAQAVGAGRLAEAGRLARQALLWAALIAVPLTAIGLPLTPALIGLFGLERAVADVAAGYLGVTMGAVATITVMLLASAVLRGAGDSRTPMLVTLLANVVNVALSWALIYGHAGLPALGAVGSAWGTVLSRGLGAAVLVAVLLRGRHGVRIGGGGSWMPRLGAFGGIVRIGLPAALEEVLIIGAFATLTPVVATLGTEALAAHRVAINILSLSFLPGIGFGLAATALVGQAVGAHQPDEARASTTIALRWALIWMGALAALFLVFARQLTALFSQDPALVAIGAAAVVAVALAQPLWAASFVYAGALRGTGDTRTPLVITGTMMWAAVLIGFLALRVIPELWAVWGAFILTGPVETFLFWRAWRKANLNPASPAPKEAPEPIPTG